MSVQTNGCRPPVVDRSVYLMLAQVPRALVSEYGIPASAVPSYRQFNYAAIAMRIPTEMIGKRYFVRHTALPAIIEHFGLASSVVDRLKPASAAA
jgi:hypothetical protein